MSFFSPPTCRWQGADPASEGRGGQDPPAAGGEQVGPGGAEAGVGGRGPREGRGMGCPVRRDVRQDSSQCGQGTK